MPSGPDTYDVLYATKTKPFTLGSVVPIHPDDVIGLRKLVPSDLIARGHADHLAEEVCKFLARGDLTSLGLSMGVELVISPAAPRLFPEDAYEPATQDDGQSA